MKYIYISFIFMSCSFSQQKENMIKQDEEVSDIVLNDAYYEPLTPSDIFILIDFVIDISLISFDDAEYSIGPVFFSDITIVQLKENFDKNEYSLEYSENDIIQFYTDCNLLKGDSIKKFLSNKEKLQRISEEFSDVIVFISPPMVDRIGEKVFFKSKTIFHYREGLGSDEVIYGFKLKDKLTWELFYSKRITP